MNHTKPDFDIGIIGGGPAGAAIASYLAKAGINCVVFERELFPRQHVGESLVPSSTRVFRDLGFLQTMEENNFVHKLGAVWTTAATNIWAADPSAPGKPKTYSHQWEDELFQNDSGVLDVRENMTSSPIRFAEREQEGVNQHYTYHVDRGKFDLLFLQHAHKLGATVYEGIAVKDVDFSGEY